MRKITSVAEAAKHSGKIKKAYDLAEKSHKGQVRLSGKPFFHHCKQVANIIISWTNGHIDEELIAAALLHDITEETKVTVDSIKKEFGEEIALLVDGVSKFKSKSTKETDKKTRRKIVSRGYIDPRVFVLKLADRVHNMRTYEFLPKETQKRKAKETKNMYAKLAQSLGMWEVKSELEDIAFSVLEPKIYTKIKQQTEKDKRTKDYLKILTNKVMKLLRKNSIKAEISPRINSCWTIRTKKENYISQGYGEKEALKKINDLVSIRIRLNDLQDCFKALGVLEKGFVKVTDETRFDNYLVKPRLNGYSALQITLDTKYGSVELAITTKEKEDFNRHGILTMLTNGDKDKLGSYILKIIFTDDDEIVFMHPEATGVDLAYLHPETAPSATGVIINGNRKPLTRRLPDGSTVSVTYGRKAKRAPNKKLLNFALPKTRTVMQKQLNLKKRDLLVANGQRKMRKSLEKRGLLNIRDTEDHAWQLVYLFSAENIDDLHLKYAKGIIGKRELAKNLDELGLTKESAGFTSIELKGRNVPGVLAKVSNQIAKQGGNIENIIVRTPGNKFLLRFVITNLKPNGEKKLRQTLSKDKVFDKVSVV